MWQLFITRHSNNVKNLYIQNQQDMDSTKHSDIMYLHSRSPSYIWIHLCVHPLPSPLILHNYCLLWTAPIFTENCTPYKFHTKTFHRHYQRSTYPSGHLGRLYSENGEYRRDCGLKCVPDLPKRAGCVDFASVILLVKVPVKVLAFSTMSSRRLKNYVSLMYLCCTCFLLYCINTTLPSLFYSSCFR